MIAALVVATARLSSRLTPKALAATRLSVSVPCTSMRERFRRRLCIPVLLVGPIAHPSGRPHQRGTRPPIVLGVGRGQLCPRRQTHFQRRPAARWCCLCRRRSRSGRLRRLLRATRAAPAHLLGVV